MEVSTHYKSEDRPSALIDSLILSRALAIIFFFLISFQLPVEWQSSLWLGSAESTFTFYDFLLPLVLLTLGAYARESKYSLNLFTLFGKALLLILLGIVINVILMRDAMGDKFTQELGEFNIFLTGNLQTIGIVLIIGSLCIKTINDKTFGFIAFLIIIIVELINISFFCSNGLECSLANYLNGLLPEQTFLFDEEVPFQSNGPISIINSIAIFLIGYSVCKEDSLDSKIGYIVGGVILISGILLHLTFMPYERLYLNPTSLLITSGTGIFIIAGLYQLMKLPIHNLWVIGFFRRIGRNAVAYFFVPFLFSNTVYFMILGYLVMEEIQPGDFVRFAVPIVLFFVTHLLLVITFIDPLTFYLSKKD